MMTKQDFETVASAIRGLKHANPDGICTVGEVEVRLERAFAGNNPRFNKDTFERACRVDGEVKE